MPALEEPLVMAGQVQSLVQDLIAILSGSHRGAAQREEKISPGPDPAQSLSLGAIAEKLYADRRKRANYLPPDLFAEPSWDILLDLYASTMRGRRVSVTDACIAAAAPSTTALRWLQILEAGGLIVRVADSRDRRRTYVQLTPEANEKITAYLERLAGDDASPRAR